MTSSWDGTDVTEDDGTATDIMKDVIVTKDLPSLFLDHSLLDEGRSR